MASHKDKDMNREEIIERYWKGETTLEEEAWLKENGDIHPLFQYTKSLGDQTSKLSLQQITGGQNTITQNVPEAKVIHFNRWIARIAAGLLILAAVTFLIKTDGEQQDATQVYAETYDNPQQAYEEVREALLLISSKINKTSDQVASQISKAEPYTEIFK